jgi:hypothetical protein
MISETRVSKIEQLFFTSITLMLIVLTGCSKKAEERVWIERWSHQRPMMLKRGGLGAVSVGKRIYAIGGGEFGKSGLKVFGSVEYADVLDDGELSEWRYTSSLKVPRIYIAVAVYGDYIYVMGGEGYGKGLVFYRDGKPASLALFDSVERAKILPDGTLGEWILEKKRMHTARRGGELYASNGWLYAVGGFAAGSFLNDVERAKINDDGSLGEWIREENWPSNVRYISGYVSKGNRFYLLGGHMPSFERAIYSVETAEVMPDGTLSKWQETSPMYTRRFLNTAVLAGDTIYDISGQNSIDLTSTERAMIQEDGMLSPWEPDTPLNKARRAAASVLVGDTIYVLGGAMGLMGFSLSLNDVESATIAQGKRLGDWAKAVSGELESYRTWKKSIPLDARNHLESAMTLLAKGDYNKISFDLMEALKIYPEYFEAYNLMGDMNYRIGKVDGAIEALKRSIEIKAGNFNALIGLGNISLEQRNFKEAVDYYKGAVQADPDSVLAHNNLGNAYFNSRDYASAFEEFKWVLDREPDSKDAKHLLDLSQKSMEGGNNQ